MFKVILIDDRYSKIVIADNLTMSEAQILWANLSVALRNVVFWNVVIWQE